VTTETEPSWVSRLSEAISLDKELIVTEQIVPSSSVREAILEIAVQGRIPRLRVSGAIFQQPVDLTHLNGLVAIALTHCEFKAGIDVSVSSISSLDLSNSRLSVFEADGVVLAGDLSLSHVSADRLSLREATIRGSLDLSRSSIRGACTPSSDPVIYLDATRISGTLYMPGATVVGELSAISLSVGGQLNLADCSLRNPGRRAVSFDGATIGQILILDKLNSEGELSFPGVTVKGQITARDCTFENASGVALKLDSADIAGQTSITGVTAIGVISAVSMKTGSDLYFSDTSWRLSFTCLDLNRSTVQGNLQFTRVVTDGDVRLNRMRVAGSVVLSGCEFRGQDGREALRAESLYVDGDLIVSRTTARGPFVLSRAVVRGTTDWQGSKLEDPKPAIISVRGVLAGGLMLDTEGLNISPVELKHGLHLENCSLERLHSDDEQAPGPLFCAGWKVSNISGRLWDDPQRVATWIEQGEAEEGYLRPGSWHEVASAYEATGNISAGRKLRYRAARRLTARAPWHRKPYGWTYNAIVGHGYYPLFAAGWIMGLLSLIWSFGYTLAHEFTTTILVAGSSETHTASESCSALPKGTACFNPVQYALEQAIPSLTGSQTGTWHVAHSPWLSIGLTLCKGVIWVLDTFLLAGIAGLLRRT
jgi:hypothetical protein